MRLRGSSKASIVPAQEHFRDLHSAYSDLPWIPSDVPGSSQACPRAAKVIGKPAHDWIRGLRELQKRPLMLEIMKIV